MSGTVSLLFATFASEEGGHAAATWMGVPLWIWQSINLVLFFYLLYRFVIRKLIDHFRQRQLDLEERLRLAEQQRRDAQNVAAEIRERMAKVEREVEGIRQQGRADGEVEKAALFARADEEARRVEKDAQAQIERRVSAAMAELRAAAADLTADAAKQIVAQNIEDADRKRLLEEGVGKLGEPAR